MKLTKNQKIGLGVAGGIVGTTALGYLLTRKAKAAPPPGKALLAVDTTPVKGEIYLDGMFQGVAPLTIEVDPGTYTVSFGGVSGYITPSPQTVTLAEGETREVTGIYTPIITPPEKATLIIRTTDSAGNLLDGAIYLNGAYQGTREVTLYLDAGTYQVSFGDLAGYYTPSAETVTLTAGSHTTMAGVYYLVTQLATVRGKVTDAETGVGIAGVLVSSPYQVYQTLTDASGDYEITGLTPAYFVFTFEKEGYLTKNLSITLVAGENILNCELQKALGWVLYDVWVEPTPCHPGAWVSVWASFQNASNEAGTRYIYVEINAQQQDPVSGEIRPWLIGNRGPTRYTPAGGRTDRRYIWGQYLDQYLLPGAYDITGYIGKDPPADYDDMLVISGGFLVV